MKKLNYSKELSVEKLLYLSAKDIKVHTGLKIAGKEKFFKPKTIRFKDKIGYKKHEILNFCKQFEIDFNNQHTIFDPSENRMALRTIKTSQQFDPEYEVEEEVIEFAEKRKKENTFLLEELKIGKIYYIDFLVKGKKGSEKVRLKQILDKRVLVEGVKTKKLKSLSFKQLFNTSLKIHEDVVSKNTFNAVVYRFLGVKPYSNKEVWQPFGNVKNVFFKKVYIAVAKPNAKVIQKEKNSGFLNFDYYTFSEVRLDCVGKLILKIEKDMIYPYILIENIPREKGFSDVYQFCEIFKIEKTGRKKGQPPKKKDVYEKIGDVPLEF